MTSDGKWPMCGRPDEYACERCQQLGKRCYCEGGAAKSFTDLADRTKAGWSDETRRVYEAASSEIRAEVER